MLCLEEVRLHLLGVSLLLTKLLSLQFGVFQFGLGLGARCSCLINLLVGHLPFFLKPFFFLACSELLLGGNDVTAPRGTRTLEDVLLPLLWQPRRVFD